MRSYPTAIAEHIAARRPTIARQLIWVEAKEFGSGATQTLGLWDGEYTAQFVIDGEPRTYFAGGSILQLPEITGLVGLEVRTYSVVLSALTPEVQQLMRGYDVRLAPCEMHRVLFDPEAPATMLGEPQRTFKGWIDGAQFNETKDGDYVVDATLASNSRGLTVPLQMRRSDESYRLRLGDRIARYASVAGVIPIYFGEAAPNQPPAPRPPAVNPNAGGWGP